MRSASSSPLLRAAPLAAAVPGLIDLDLEYVDEGRIPDLCNCLVCLSPLIHPRTGPCGHSFCNQCILRVIERKPECPKCKQPLHEEELRDADGTLQHLLGDLKVFCPQKDDGCDWSGPRSNVEEHLSRFCAFMHVPCTNSGRGCNDQVVRNQLDNHLAHHCSVVKREKANRRAQSLHGEFEKLNPVTEDIIKINAGGVRIETTRHTLCRYPESKLAALFAGSWELRCDEDGYIFLDRPGNAFWLVVEWLRSGDVESANPVWRKEALFWELLPLEAAVVEEALDSGSSVGTCSLCKKEIFGSQKASTLKKQPVHETCLLRWRGSAICSSANGDYIPAQSKRGMPAGYVFSTRNGKTGWYRDAGPVKIGANGWPEGWHRK